MSRRALRTLSKPAGLSVLPRHDNPESDCLVRRLLDEEPWRGSLSWPNGFAAGVAHRLDVSTSGALAVADDPADLARIRAAFTGHALVKRYLFWASREVPWDRNRCERPLAHDRRHRSRMVVQRSAHTPHRGRWFPAQTSFERVEGSLWRARMSTGVTHQIRLHAAFVGLAIRGDRQYGGGPTPDDAPSGLTFYLHHEGFEGADLHTTPVPEPSWVRAARGAHGR